MRHATSSRLVAVAVGVWLSAGAGACNGKGADNTDTVARPGAGPLGGPQLDTVEVEAEQESVPAMPIRRGKQDSVIVARPTPTLPKPLDSLTNQELVAYLNTLAYKVGGFNTQTANVPCTGAGCGPGDSAHVLIQPEEGMNQWEHDSVPAKGIIVARIINDSPTGTDAATFGYPAQRKTWWIVDSAGGALRSRFFVRMYTDPDSAVHYVTAPRQFYRCVHADAPAGRRARAKFWGCAESADDSTYSMGGSAARSPTGVMTQPPPVHLVSLRSAVPPLPAPRPIALTANWVSCGSGCCATSP